MNRVSLAAPRALLPAALSALVLGFACGDLPSVPPLPDQVRRIVFLQPCNVVPRGGECLAEVEGRDANGNPVLGPIFTWNSSNTNIFTVQGSGPTAVLAGINFGNATLRVTSSGGVSEQRTVRVVTPR